jgi:hypothetical protein
MVKKSARLHAKWIAVALLAMFALVGQSLVMAQTPTAEVEIVGTVSAVTAQTLTIGTQTFDITHAEIKVSVTVGKLVKIHATQSTVGQWIAREVELAQPAAAQTPSPLTTEEPTPLGEFEITGQITALSDNSIVIAGHVIDISNAEIKDPLSINNRAKVHVSIVDGVWIAREVESASIGVTGTLSATIQGDDGRHGQDDGANHDQNDDRGGNNNSNDDHGNHGGSDDQQPDDNHNDNHGGNNDDGGHGGGNDSGGGHG